MKAPMPRRALTFSVLRLFGNQLASLPFPWQDKQVIWLAALWGFWGAARMSALIVDKHGPDNVRTVTYLRVRWLSPDHFVVHLPLPKNKKLPAEMVDLRVFPDPRYCPITQLNNLVDFLEQAGPVDQANPIFRLSNGNILTMDNMNHVLKLALRPLFPDQEGFWSCHSFRAGLATTMGLYPHLFSQQEIQAVGRWNSEAYQVYCRKFGISQEIAYNKIFSVINLH